MSDKITTITNARMSQFAETIKRQVATILDERADDILTAWHENMEEATENETKLPPLKVTFAATVDLAKNEIETTLRFTVAYTTKVSEIIEDPNQTTMPEITGTTKKAK